MTQPIVTIGMPVYNAIGDICRVLDSLLAQTHRDFELLISDNASTDGTSQILQDYAARDARIRHIRQPENIGANRNFQYVLDHAQGEFFMWAASDDVRSPDFLAVNLAFLQAHPDFVASTSPVRFDHGEFHERNMGDRSLTGDAPERLIGMFEAFHANGRFFSLMRRDAVSDCRHLSRFFLGADWAVVLHLAARGKMNRAQEGWVVLGSRGVSATHDIFAIFRKGWRSWLMPFHELTGIAWGLARGYPLLARLRLATGLAVLNGKAFIGQFITMVRRRRP
ncbi:MAG: glycosyltransferase family 2 protein [Pseudomonadota bacterium]